MWRERESECGWSLTRNSSKRLLYFWFLFIYKKEIKPISSLVYTFYILFFWETALQHYFYFPCYTKLYCAHTFYILWPKHNTLMHKCSTNTIFQITYYSMTPLLGTLPCFMIQQIKQQKKLCNNWQIWLFFNCKKVSKITYIID